MSNHIIITGTGRAGTTLLVQLLTLLGFDTGFTEKDFKTLIHPVSLGGLERDIRDHGKKPYIIKSPWICDYIDEVLDRPDITIDHVIIPIRDISDAATSRELVSEQGVMEGGLWGIKPGEFGSQDNILAHKLCHLFLSLSKEFIPITFIHFPKFIEDPIYLQNKLYDVFDSVSHIHGHSFAPKLRYDKFLPIFKSLVNPDLIDVK